MELDQFINYSITILALIASLLAWVAKIKWSNEFKAAKEAEIKAKTAQMEAIREKAEFYESIISKKLIEYSKSTIAELEALVDKTEKSKQEEINKILNRIKINAVSFQEKYHANDNGSLLALISHELRTPINAIIGFNELTLGEDVDIEDNERKQFAEIIDENARRLLSVVNDLFELAISAQIGDIESGN